MEEETLSSLKKLPWWRTDLYTNEVALPEQIEELAGPKGVALVKCWPDGRTDVGWGMRPGKNAPKDQWFWPMYYAGRFNARRVLHGYARKMWAFAVVMRSVRLVAIDIDGKNGGLEEAGKLGWLPPTLAETSKSGDGFHLLYQVDDLWVEEEGYAAFRDHIGIEQGIDIRSVGCLYHHQQQRWNYREVAPLPRQLRDKMLARSQRHANEAAVLAKTVADDDPIEVLMMQDSLLTDLKKPIPDGKRNNTLFAIGQKMKAANTPDWEDHITTRGHQVGLDTEELETLVRNIRNYD